MFSTLDLKSIHGMQCLPSAQELGICMLAGRLLGKGCILRTLTDQINEGISLSTDRLVIRQHYWEVEGGRGWALDG